MTTDATPYDELDPDVVSLVRTLNALPDVHTLSSCGGHSRPGPGQWRAGTWYVTFWIEPGDSGWAALELLSWAINIELRGKEEHVILVPRATAPSNHHAETTSLHFIIEGYTGSHPDAVALFLDSVRDQVDMLQDGSSAQTSAESTTR